MRIIIKDVRQWKIRFDILRFGIMSLVVVVVWAGIELYNTYSSTTIPEDYSDKIEPLNPSLDLEMLSEIESRIDAPENFSVVVETEEDEVPLTQQTKLASPSSILESSPPASESGS